MYDHYAACCVPLNFNPIFHLIPRLRVDYPIVTRSNLNKQDEINTTNAKANATVANTTIFHLLDHDVHDMGKVPQYMEFMQTLGLSLGE